MSPAPHRAISSRRGHPLGFRSRHPRGRARSRRGVAQGEPQSAPRARRQGDGPRLAGRRAAGGSVPLRRRRPRLPLARRPRAPPDRLPRARSATARRRCRSRCGCRSQGRAQAPRRRRGGRRPAHGPPLHRRRDAARGARRAARPVATTAWRRPSTCSARRRSPTGEADRYAARCGEALDAWPRSTAGWPERPALEADAPGRIPRANLSVKVSALTPLLRPDAPERRQARRRGAPARLLRRARELGAHLHIDMESLRLARGGHRPRARAARRGRVPRRAVGRARAAGLPARLAPQLCERDPRLGAGDAARPRRWWCAWSRAPTGTTRSSRPRQHGWQPPVFEVKADSDRNFEALTRRLLEARPAVRVAIASHNLRSVAHAIAVNRALGGDDRDLELQVLRGLGDDLQAGAGRARPARAHLLPGRRPGRRHGLPRAPPAGEHEQRVLPARAGARRVARGAAGARRDRPAAFANEPIAGAAPRAGARRSCWPRWPRSSRRCRCACRCWIGDERAPRRRAAVHRSRRSPSASSPPRRAPPRPRSTPPSRPPPRGFARWRRPPPPSAREVLVRRGGLAARAPRRAGRAGGARVRQAVGRGRRRRLRGDRLPRVLRARGAVALDRGTALLQVPGERNALRYAPRGVVAVISPWNFPLAIPLGMTAAGAGHRQRRRAQAGRAVAGVRRCMLVRALREAGVPAGCARAAARRGRRRRGARAPSRACTRSPSPARAPVGLEIVARGRTTPERQRHLKRVVAEMGGKNCVIVDSDADLDDAVPAIVSSAFVYAGQKCSAASRVLVHEAIADALLERARRRGRGARRRPGRRPSAPTCRR